MNSEEELAGVLGHEIGHVTARHAVRRQTAQAGAGLFSVVVAMATGSANAARAASQAAGAFTSGYGRNHELEADRLGAEYLARTGYDPQKMLDVVGILKDQEEFEKQRAREENRAPRNYHGVFATHPKNDARLQEVIKAADRFRVDGVRRTDPEKFLRLMEGVVFGHSEDQGILRGSEFYHKKLDFRLSMPDQWRIDNQPNQLVAVRPDNKAAILVSLDQRGDHDNAGQYLKASFPNLSQLQKVNRKSYSGLTRGQTPFGDGPIRVAAQIHGDHIFVFSGIAQGQLPDRQVYDMIKSFRKLNKNEIKLATAKHLELVRAKPGESFASLAKKLKLGRYGEEQLRLINGLYPNGEPQSGKLIKIIR